jgi:hypothetical protein
MNELELKATVVSVTNEDGVCIVGFADDPANPIDYLILQRGTSEDEQDKRLGQNTYFLEVSGGQIGYGGIQRAVLKANSFEIRRNKTKASALERLTVNFEIATEKWKELAESLQFVFHDSDAQFSAVE